MTNYKYKDTVFAVDFDKVAGMLPAIIQNKYTLEVLMMGYMNPEALEKTLATNQVTFFSRTKNRLWTKGEESGHVLHLKSLHMDCDNDTLVLKVDPIGPTCHTGSRSCFQTELNQNFIFELEEIIKDRIKNPQEKSYVNKMHLKGLNKIAQKVGEEAVETVIAALNETREDFINESSDLLFHLLMLLNEKEVSLKTIAKNLKERHQK
jgi:phosphoribosyl-AMP cyclohydrolase / phosphoribosyl-ATP pyrophosphohydrolase